jgi:hypothetical protein
VLQHVYRSSTESPTCSSQKSRSPLGQVVSFFRYVFRKRRKAWFSSGTGALMVHVNQQGESHILRIMPLGTWGVPSPDGAKLAFIDEAVDSNVWMCGKWHDTAGQPMNGLARVNTRSEGENKVPAGVGSSRPRRHRLAPKYVIHCEKV